jgi:hypothetical protein
MSKPFTLSLQRVECNQEQFSEPGKDELYLLGFGITPSGKSFVIRPRSLGSFGTGKVTGTDGYPKTLVDIHVPDEEGLVTTCMWLFERDSGDLAHAGHEITEDFFRAMNKHLTNSSVLGLSPDARQYYAFGHSMLDMREPQLAFEAHDGWNSDDIMGHFFHDHVASALPLGGPQTYEVSPAFDGFYTLTFEFNLPGVLPDIVITPT